MAGSLEVGKLADFIVLDRDPFASPRHPDPPARSVQETWIGGQQDLQAVPRIERDAPLGYEPRTAWLRAQRPASKHLIQRPPQASADSGRCRS